MQVAHLLRKYNPDEWGGTETAIQRLLDGLSHHGVRSVVYSPRLDRAAQSDPLAEAGCIVRRFSACVPVWGISPEQRRQLVAVGGNIFSFDIVGSLLRQPDLSLIHSHAHNRLGGIALTVARLRRVPLVVTIHGGVLDLPAAARDYLSRPLQGGVEWGKIAGFLFQSRRVLEKADALITCNRTEAELLRHRYPRQRVVVQPHGVPAKVYAADHREAALAAFPSLAGRCVLLVVGRIDPVKNQRWLVENSGVLFQRFPDMTLVFAGAATDPAYAASLQREIAARGLERQVMVTGGLPPGDPRLVGLFQTADALVLPSISETFGLVILEAWAAGTPVISSRTSGASALVREGENGWLFDLSDPATFHRAVAEALGQPNRLRELGAAGRDRVLKHFDTTVLGGQVRKLYDELIEQRR